MDEGREKRQSERETVEQKEKERRECGRPWRSERWDLHYAMRTDKGITQTHTHTNRGHALVCTPTLPKQTKAQMQANSGRIAENYTSERISLAEDSALSELLTSERGEDGGTRESGREPEGREGGEALTMIPVSRHTPLPQ